MDEIVFPARAGMIPGKEVTQRQHRRIPRESGDDPPGVGLYIDGQRYSPRERG